MLATSDVGGECYHGGQHACFSRQGRKPLPLYKVEEMCERCAASWHAVMAATLLDSVVISQQFLGLEPTTKLEQHFLHSSNGAAVVGATVAAKARRQPAVPPKARKRKVKVKESTRFSREPPEAVDDAFSLSVEPQKQSKQYSVEERKQIAEYYKTLPRSQKAPFNRRYNVKVWQMRDWAK
jgi:hypothetical protein